MSIKALQSYRDAAKLGGESQSTANPGSIKSTDFGGAAFKAELSSLAHTVLGGIKQTGASAEHAIATQIFGAGNVEKTALSLQELNTHMEIVSQALRIAVEKINELTTRTMGG